MPYSDRLPLRWDEDPFDLRPHYRTLIALRHRLACLRSRSWALLDVEPAERVLGYVRYASPGDPPALVLLNFAGQAAEATIPLPVGFNAVAGASLGDALGGEAFAPAATAAVRIPMPAWSARVLAPSGG